MAVKSELKAVKVVVKTEHTAQTFSDCRRDASNEQLYKFGDAVGKLFKESVTSITKVEETMLTKE